MSQPDASKPTTISQQPNKRDWIPIIVGAIAALLGGGILASIFNSLISYVNAPNVQVQIKPDGKHNGNNAWFLVKNTGQLAAKHVKLTISAPEEITRNETFSTENMTLEKPRPTILEANMQRLVKGEGSFVNISLAIKAKPNINYINRYVASVTYDEGSNKGGPSIEYPQYTTYIIYFIIYIAASIAAIFFFRRLIYRRRYFKLLVTLYEQTENATNKYMRDFVSNTFKMRLNRYYNAGKLHKADYESLLKLEKQMEIEINRLEEEVMIGAITYPTKSVHKIKRYTSEGKPIITDEK
jgi:hypothetical protein